MICKKLNHFVRCLKKLELFKINRFGNFKFLETNRFRSILIEDNLSIKYYNEKIIKI